MNTPNFLKIQADTGCCFNSLEDIVLYVVRTLEYFDYHNKNLTKEQYNRIMLIKDIMKGVQE